MRSRSTYANIALAIAVAFALVFAAGLARPIAADQAAGDTRLGDLTIRGPWARASIGKARAGVAYLTIVNHGDAPERLIGVEGDVARRPSLHGHAMVDGIMRMRPVEAVELPAGASVRFQPGGLHIMLMGLEGPLIEGERMSLTLHFQTAGRIAVEIPIKSATAMDGGGD